MPHYPVAKQVCFALSTVKGGLVSEWVTRANPNFFINEILNFGTAMIFQIFHLFIIKIAKNLAFFCSFSKVFTLYSSRKKFCKLTVIQTSTVPHNSMQVSCAPNRLFCGFVLFWRTESVSLNFTINKDSQFLKTFLSASSISSTMQDILLQKSTAENGGQKEFYAKANE